MFATELGFLRWFDRRTHKIVGTIFAHSGLRINHFVIYKYYVWSGGDDQFIRITNFNNTADQKVMDAHPHN